MSLSAISFWFIGLILKQTPIFSIWIEEQIFFILFYFLRLRIYLKIFLENHDTLFWVDDALTFYFDYTLKGFNFKGIKIS